MPGVIQEEDIVKIQLAKIVGFSNVDQCDSLPYNVIEHIDQHWPRSVEELLSSGVVSREELKKLGATLV